MRANSLLAILFKDPLRIFPQALQWFSEGRISTEGHKVIVAPAAGPVKKIDYIEGCLVSPALEEKI